MKLKSSKRNIDESKKEQRNSFCCSFFIRYNFFQAHNTLKKDIFFKVLWIQVRLLSKGL